MKRRNVESSAGKLRRAAKRGKISDGYSSVLCNLKYLFVWAIVIILDFVADFRFELLHPLWVFTSTVSETYKFSGISYLLSYISITLAIDMICYYLIPIHWLFFASSTYIWLQFTWYSERFSCFTVFVWMFFIGMEAFVRLRELKSMPFQFELCRPLAAHGIGFQIFNLGIECKKKVVERLLEHKKRVVAKENEFYYSLLNKALGPESFEQQTIAAANNNTNNTAVVGTGPLLLDYSTGGQVTKYIPNNNNNMHNSVNNSATFSISQNSIANNSSGYSNENSNLLVKSHSISAMHSNGTSIRTRSSHLSTTTTSNSNPTTNSTTNSTTNPINPTTEHTTENETLLLRSRTLVRTVVLSLCTLFILDPARFNILPWYISKCALSSINSIHRFVSKGLQSLKRHTIKATSTASSTSTSANSSAASNSQTTTTSPNQQSITQQTTTTSNDLHSGSAGTSGSNGKANRRESFLGDHSSSSSPIKRQKSNEEIVRNDLTGNSSSRDVSTSSSGQSTPKSRHHHHHQNGSINRGKSLELTSESSNSNSSSMLNSKKSNSSRTLDTSKSGSGGSFVELTNKSFNSGNNSPTTSLPVLNVVSGLMLGGGSISASSSSESISGKMKMNISSSSNNNLTSVIDGKMPAITLAKCKEVTMNGNCVANPLAKSLGSSNSSHNISNGLDLVHGSVVNGSCTTSTISSTTTTTSNSKSNNSRRSGNNKRTSLEDASSLLEVIKAKEDNIWRLDSDNQRLKAKVQTSELCQSDLRQQLSLSQTSEKTLKSMINVHQTEIEHLQKKLQSYQQWKQADKTNIQRLEKLLEDEKKKAKVSGEAQMVSEKKAKIAEDAAARANAIAEAVRNVCSESCRMRQREVELEMSNLRKELCSKEDKLRLSAKLIDEHKEAKDKANMLMAALSAMHDKNSQLEEMLNIEKIVKMEMFTHMEECKRAIGKHRLLALEQDKEIRELKRKLALFSAQQSLNHVMTSSAVGGCLSLNGYNSISVPINNNSSTSDNIDLVNRCFSSCSPNNAAAASPSSLSSGTPPLAQCGAGVVGNPSSSMVVNDCSGAGGRSMCNVSPVAVSNASPFMLPTMRDVYSSYVDGPLMSHSPWPNSLSNKSNHHSSSSQSDMIIANSVGGGSMAAVGTPTSIGGGQGQLQSNAIGSGGVVQVSSNGSVVMVAKPVVGGIVKLNEFDSSNPTNLAFNNRFDM